MTQLEGKPLEGVLKNIIQDIGKKDRFTQEEIVDIWNTAVGKRAAKHSNPVSLKKTELFVTVDGSGWLYELTTKKREILKKLEGKLKGKSLKSIRFRIGEIK